MTPCPHSERRPDLPCPYPGCHSAPARWGTHLVLPRIEGNLRLEHRTHLVLFPGGALAYRYFWHVRYE